MIMDIFTLGRDVWNTILGLLCLPDEVRAASCCKFLLSISKETFLKRRIPEVLGLALPDEKSSLLKRWYPIWQTSRLTLQRFMQADEESVIDSMQILGVCANVLIFARLKSFDKTANSAFMLKVYDLKMHQGLDLTRQNYFPVAFHDELIKTDVTYCDAGSIKSLRHTLMIPEDSWDEFIQDSMLVRLKWNGKLGKEFFHFPVYDEMCDILSDSLAQISLAKVEQ